MESGIKKDKIICIGNRLILEDALAMRVYDLLSLDDNGCGIEIIEGGIAGLNLLGHLENSGNIVFVDAVSGFIPAEEDRLLRKKSASSGQIVVLNQQEITDCLPLEDFHYGHDSGIAYLLSVLPMVCDGPLPEAVFLVGLEGDCSHETLEKAALITIELAMGGKDLYKTILTDCNYNIVTTCYNQEPIPSSCSGRAGHITERHIDASVSK